MTLRVEALAIPVDRQTIRGSLIAPSSAAAARPAPGVLFVHGWGGCQDEDRASARAIAALGWVSLTFDLRGHAETGEQHETVTREDNVRDVIAAYEVLAGRADPAFIAVVGASYGAYLGALLLYLRPVRLLALRAPALYKDDNWEAPKRKLHIDPDFAAYRRLALRTEDNRALGACAQFAGEALVVESEHDEIVPHPAVANYVAALANAHSLTYRVLEGADHGLSRQGWQLAYTELLVNWLSEMLKERTCNAASP